MRKRMNVILTLGFILLGVLAVTPATASADPCKPTDPKPQWELQGPFGTVCNGQAVQSLAVPSSITGRIAATDKPILWVKFSPDANNSQSVLIEGTGADFSASWTYSAEGNYKPAAWIHYQDGSDEFKYGDITVTDPANHNTQVSISASNPFDQSKDVVKVDYTGTEVSFKWLDSQGSTGQYGAPTSVTTDSAGHHATFRFGNLPEGTTTFYAHSGDKEADPVTVQVVGQTQPPPPDPFWKMSVSSSAKKLSGGKCLYQTVLGVSTNQASTGTVKVRLLGKLKGKSWKTLASKSVLKSYPVMAWKLPGPLTFSVKKGTVRSYIKKKASFRYQIDKTSVAWGGSNGWKIYNPKSKYMPVSSSRLGSCRFNSTPKVTSASVGS